MLTADDWPIAAAMLSHGDAHPTGETEPAIDRWRADLLEVADAGFSEVDLTDSWVRPGDLTPEQSSGLRECLASTGLTAVSLSAIRRSVIDERHGEENLAYSHRTLDCRCRARRRGRVGRTAPRPDPATACAAVVLDGERPSRPVRGRRGLVAGRAASPRTRPPRRRGGRAALPRTVRAHVPRHVGLGGASRRGASTSTSSDSTPTSAT